MSELAQTEIKLGLDRDAPLVDRLRAAPMRLFNVGAVAGALMQEAADEIERIISLDNRLLTERKTEVERLREALDAIAEISSMIETPEADNVWAIATEALGLDQQKRNMP